MLKQYYLLHSTVTIQMSNSLLSRTLKLSIMTTLENIIGNYNSQKEGDLTHRKNFFNSGSSKRDNWYSRRRFGY